MTANFEPGRSVAPIAAEFTRKHIDIADDFEVYQQAMIDEATRENIGRIARGERIKPFWVRRSMESGSEFEATFDYMLQTAEGYAIVAMIDLDTSTTTAYLPKADETSDFYPALTLPRDHESLQNAIIFTESAIKGLTT